MSNEKFIYNNHTLQYEKIEVSPRERALKIFGLLSALIVTSLISYPVWQKIFPTADVQMKDREIEQLKLNYLALQKQTELQTKALESLDQRYGNLFRGMFNMDPIDPAVWNGGVGGHDRFANLANFGSARTISETLERAEKLSQRIAITSKTIDEVAKLAREKESMLSSIPSIKPVRSDLLAAGLQELSGFGWRLHPIHKVRRFHKGIDFTADKGTAIQATGDGTVEKAGFDGGYGKCVIINHGYGYKTLYGHMSQIDVSEGQKVKKGQLIGKIGSTGSSTGPHCHYEVHFKGEIVNPLQYCLDGLTPSEYSALVMAASREGNSKD